MEMPRKRRFDRYRLGHNSYNYEARQTPVLVVLRSRRPSKKQVEAAYNWLETHAENARNNAELDAAVEANNLLLERLGNTEWARKAMDWHEQISKNIRRRSDELRVKESKTKVGGGLGIKGVGITAEVERQTSGETPRH